LTNESGNRKSMLAPSPARFGIYPVTESVALPPDQGEHP
jgi:hypothetical protein